MVKRGGEVLLPSIWLLLLAGVWLQPGIQLLSGIYLLSGIQLLLSI
jgi:hypothetical protein